MSKIVVYNTHIEINNYEYGDSFKLEKFFSVFDKTTHRFYPDGIYYDEKNKKAYLPRGIDIQFIENLFSCNAMYVNEHDNVGKVDKILIRYLPRNEAQRESIDFMLCKNKYIRNEKRSQLSLNLDTGAGKTYVAVMAASYYRYRTGVIAPSIDWLKQWKERIIEYTDIEPDEIYMISGIGTIARLLNGMRDISKIKFFLISHSTIRNYGEKYGWGKVGELFNTLGIGIKVYDEAHLSFKNMCMIDFFTNSFKTYYLTASLDRSDRSENRIFQAYFKNIPKLNLFDEDKDPHANYLALLYNSRPTAIDIKRCCSNKYGFSAIMYAGYVIKRPNFYKLLSIVLYIAANNNGKMLIFIGKNDSILSVYEWIKYNFPIFRDSIGIYNSTIPKEIKRNELNKKIILSTIKSSGTASDISGLKYVVCLANPFVSKVIAKQTFGRLRDRNTMYIDVIDLGFAATKSYYYNYDRREVFEKYSVKMESKRFGENDLDADSKKAFMLTQTKYSDIMSSSRSNATRIQIAYRV